MRFKIDMKLKNLNETISDGRGNRFKANANKQKEMLRIMEYLPEERITEFPIKIHFKWHMKNINADLDNRIEKNILDAMVKVGILPNDNIKHINYISHEAIKAKSDWVEVEIETNRKETI